MKCKAHKEAYLLDIGELIIGKNYREIHTLLGSCISVAFYHRASSFYAICHCKHAVDLTFQNKYQINLSEALPKMLQSFFEHGISRNKIEVSIFGGSSMSADFYSIGQKNTEFAHEFCMANQLPLFHSDCGGNQGRKIIFNTENGYTDIKYLRNQERETYLKPLHKFRALDENS